MSSSSNKNLWPLTLSWEGRTLGSHAVESLGCWGMNILDSGTPRFSWVCHRHSSWWWYGDFKGFLKINGFGCCNYFTFFPILLLIIYINLNTLIFSPPTFLLVPCVLHGCGDGCGHADTAVVIYDVESSMTASRMFKLYKLVCEC